MIVRLRKRLTLAAIAALILIFAVTVAAINLANAWSLRGQISQSLQMLMGSYIPPSEREKVFDRFYRAESAAQTQGSGIGLAIARSIAALPTDGRPISHRSDLHALYAARKPLYERFCDIMIDNTGSVESTVESITEALK